MINFKKTQEEASSAIEISEELDKHLDEKFLIEGKTRNQWRKALEIKIPEDPTLVDVARLCVKCARNYQTAARHRDNQTLTIDVLTRSRVDTYNEKYEEVLDGHIKEHGKALAAQSCKTKADLAVKHIDSAINAKKIVRDFWTKTCDTLQEVRKNLEIAGRALGAESFIDREMVIKRKG